MVADTWESRMAARAAERAAAEAERLSAEERANDPHGEHHTHLDGTAVICSCGYFFGITCVAFGDDYDPAKLSCDICGLVGMTRLGD